MLKNHSKETYASESSWRPVTPPRARNPRPVTTVPKLPLPPAAKGGWEPQKTYYEHLKVKSLGGDTKTNGGAKTPTIPLPSYLMERKPLPKIKRTAKRKGEEKTPSVQEEQEKPPVQKAQNEQLSLEVNPPTKEDVDGPLQEKIVSNGPEENTWILTLKWVTKLLLSAVFLVWIFVLGVLVGRGSVMPKSAQVLETPKIRQTQAAFSVGPGTSEAQDEEVYQEAYNPVVGTGGQLSGAYAPLERRGYDFRDNLEPDTQPGAITQAPSSPPQEADISTPSPEAAITPDSAPSPEETRVANNSDLGNNPSPQIASTPVAEIDPGYWPAEPQGTGAYTVQVGAPTSPDDAKAMVEKYRDKGFDAYYYFNGRGRYPTRVGRYETMAQAQEARNSLEKAGAREPYVSKLNV